MDSYTVLNTHSALKQRLIDYIKAQYLMNSDLLYDPIARQLEAQNSVCRDPYLEATPTYEKSACGLDGFKISPQSKSFLKDLARNDLGVFNYPYLHQQNAFEAFEQGEDLLVTTGTGSGKSECFIWPMLTKMARESTEPSWGIEGIRTLIIYPMNALVADQVGRIRRILNPDSSFPEIFRSVSGSDVRFPRFGMYTGRTPYPGSLKSEKSRRYGKTLKKEYIEKNHEIQQKLKDMGKWPSKANLEAFADSLCNNTWASQSNPLDMELLTRHEIQKTCPDPRYFDNKLLYA